MAEPVRSCVATRQRFPRNELLRLVADADGRVQVDLSGRACGRGAWIQPQAELLARFERRPSLLNRALRRKGLSTPDLLANAQQQVLQRTLSELQRCHRAGVVVSGRAAVTRQHPLVAVLLAEPQTRWVLASDTFITTLPLTALALGKLIGRGPRCVLGVRPSRPSRRLMRWLRCTCSLGYPAR